MTAADLPPQIRQRTVAKAHALLEALPFMREHHGKVIVVKYGGAAMERAPLAASFAQDIALLQSAGIMPVIVHGGGPQVTQVSAQPGHRDDVRGRVARDRRRDARRRDDGARRQAEHRGRRVARHGRRPGCGPVRRRRRDVARPQANGPGPGVRRRGGARERRRRPNVDGATVRACRGVDRRGRVRTGVQRERRRRGRELAIALNAEKLVFLNDVPGSDRSDRRPALRTLGGAMPGSPRRRRVSWRAA